MRAVVTVIGKDKVGIIAMASAECAKYGANIVDISQTVMKDYFAMIMLVDIDRLNIDFKGFVEGFEKDYGSKTNIWVCCQANDIINRPDEEIKNLKFILYDVDLKHTKLREKCLSNIMKNILLNSNISYIGAENKKGLKDFGIVYPSTGLSTICCFRKYTNLLRNNIFGFSFLNNDNNFYDHYFAKRSNKTIKRFLKNCHHNFDCESFYLNEQFKD